MPGYTHKQIVVLQTAKENTIPSAVWAENVPEGDIQMQVALFGPLKATTS